MRHEHTLHTKRLLLSQYAFIINETAMYTETYHIVPIPSNIIQSRIIKYHIGAYYTYMHKYHVNNTKINTKGIFSYCGTNVLNYDSTKSTINAPFPLHSTLMSPVSFYIYQVDLPLENKKKS